MSFHFINQHVEAGEHNAERDDWVVIEDQNGGVTWRARYAEKDDRAAAEQTAHSMNQRARSLDIKTRYHAVPESMIVVMHQLSIYHREGTDVDWRPDMLLPEDYYLQL